MSSLFRLKNFDSELERSWGSTLGSLLIDGTWRTFLAGADWSASPLLKILCKLFFWSTFLLPPYPRQVPSSDFFISVKVINNSENIN